MKNSAKRILQVAAISCAAIFAASCDDDDNSAAKLTGESKIYTLNSVSDPSITGTVKFAERDDDATVVTIDLNGTVSGNTHIAHIHENSAAETGGIIIDLSDVNGSSGLSETIVKKWNNGTAITYAQLIALNAYVNVHISATDLGTLIAQGDIGQNEITTTSTTYSLAEANASGISGTVVFAKRLSGATLVTVDLDGAAPTGNYPVSIYDHDMVTTGPIAITLNNFNGATGISTTTVRELDNNTAITYDQLKMFDGHINVSTSAVDDTFVAAGNIGSNN